MLADLPFEIVQIIVQYLHLEDKIQSSLTCKAWQAVLQESLWTTIPISNSRKLEQICTPGSQANQLCLKYGHLVRELMLSHTSATDLQLRFLQNLLPNVHKISFEEKAFKKGFWLDLETTDWAWKYLREFGIVWSVHESRNIIDTFCPILFNLPGLKKLHLNQDRLDTQLFFSLDDLECLQSKLPNLEHISTQMELPELSQETSNRLQNMATFSCLSVLECNIKSSICEWLYYFAHKYPKIRVLKTLHFVDICDVYYRNTLISFLELQTSFRYLQDIHVVFEPSTLHSYIDIWRQLKVSAKNIKHISFRVCHSTGAREDLENEMKEIFNTFSSTQESLVIDGYGNHRIKSQFISLLDHHPHLVKIYLSAFNTTIALDELLNKCPALKVLTVQHSRLRLGQTNSRYLIHHGLHTVMASYLLTDTKTLEYLSLQCRKLKHMRLKGVRIEGLISKESGSLSIDMTSTNFEMLCLEQVNFTRPLQIHNIGFISLSAQSQSLFLNTNKDRDAKNIASNQRQSREWAWFYVKQRQENPFLGYGVRRLSKAESRKARKYFSNYQKRKGADTKVKINQGNLDSLGKKDWERSLHNGFGLFKCGSIKECIVGNENDGKVYRWDNMF
ncbi:hypothetical protein CLU79DRAFT_766888, partial [Phycomyces nitens]